MSKKTFKSMLLLILFALLMYAIILNFDSTIALIKQFFGLFKPILIGVVMTLVLAVPMHFFETKVLKKLKNLSLKRSLSLLLTILSTILVFFLLVFIIFPELSNTLGIIIKAIPEVTSNLQQKLVQFLRTHNFNIDFNNLDLTKLSENLLTLFQSIMQSSILNSTLNVASMLIGGIYNVLLGLIFACYALIQKEKLSGHFKALAYAYLPTNVANNFVYVVRLTNSTFSNFVAGQGLEALVLGCMCFLMLLLIGLGKYALVISAIVIICSFIPIFGAIFGMLFGLFVILIVAPNKALLFFIFYLILQQIESNLIYPHVVGNKVGLPAIWVLFAVTVGGNLLGVTGMILFIPIVSVIYTLLKKQVLVRLKSRDIEPDDILNSDYPYTQTKKEKNTLLKDLFKKGISIRKPKKK